MKSSDCRAISISIASEGRENVGVAPAREARSGALAFCCIEEWENMQPGK